MAFIDKILQEPSYGWKDQNGEIVKPTIKQLYAEAFKNINVFKTKKNWLPLVTWVMAVCMLPFFFFFMFKYFSLPLLGCFLLYSFIVMSTHATIWFHRYSTHRSYVFSHPVWRFITQNLVPRTFPEEVYVVSHHVHHAKSDEPGDPYNPKGGFMYCMLSDVNHQAISKELTEEEYGRVARFLDHTGNKVNNYKEYQRWGSVSSPLNIITLWVLNWAFWFGVFYMVGGFGLACACFSGAMFWFVLVRAFNYTGHGGGEVKHVDGIDYDRRNLSLNQTRPGLFAGEWHNNHHLYPASARAGFLRYQLDLPWVYVYCLHKLGAVSSYKDNKKDFMRKYLNKQQAHATQKVVEADELIES